MIEAEWLACEHPGPMLQFLQTRASERKLRLFADACYKRLCHISVDGSMQMAVELELAREDARGYASVVARWGARLARKAAWLERQGQGDAKQAADTAQAGERRGQAADLRGIFGNPFRRVTLDPAWLHWNGSTVRKMAEAIYDDRAFDRLPILADALEEAGCTDHAVLDHCRQPGEHARGCWVIDLLLAND